MPQMTAEEFITELSMLCATKKSVAVMVVEGESDKKLFEQLFKPTHKLAIIPTGTRELVVSSLAVIEAGGVADLPPVCGIVDQDYSVPLKKPLTVPQVFSSDLRDVECMMISSNAFFSVANEYVDPKKLAKVAEGLPELRSLLVDICKEIGALRYWSQATNKNISFKSLELSKCIDTNAKVKLDKKKFIAHLQGAQKGITVTLEDFSAAQTLSATEQHFKAELMLCRGHDLMSAFAYILRKCIGNGGCQGVDGDVLERNFRPAFPAHWGGFVLIKSIQNWVIGLGYGTELA